MKGHKKMGSHPHDKIAAMPQFNEGHWEKDKDMLDVSGHKYTSSEMGNGESLASSVKGQVGYAKKHKMKH